AGVAAAARRAAPVHSEDEALAGPTRVQRQASRGRGRGGRAGAGRRLRGVAPGRGACLHRPGWPQRRYRRRWQSGGAAGAGLLHADGSQQRGRLRERVRPRVQRQSSALSSWSPSPRGPGGDGPGETLRNRRASPPKWVSRPAGGPGPRQWV
ncbi:unnamed protein product, partial [Prorocentrum cordatum]